MKKVFFGLFAILTCFIFASCSSNPTKTLESLTEEIENGDNFSVKEVYNMEIKATKAQIKFYESDPTEEEYEDFKDALKEFNKSQWGLLGKLDKEAIKEAEKMDDKELKELQKELKKVKKEFDKKWSKKQKDE